MIINYNCGADKEIHASPFSERSHSVIPRFKYIECLRYLTAVIRAETWSDGLIRSRERNGDTARWSQRFIELYESRPHEEYGYDPELKWSEDLFDKKTSDALNGLIKSGKMKIRN